MRDSEKTVPPNEQKTPVPPLWRSRVLVVSALAGVLLVVLVGLSANRMMVAAQQLDLGQGELLFSTLAEEIHAATGAPTVAQLNTMVDDHRVLGLVSVSFASGRTVTASDVVVDDDGDTRRLERVLPPPRDPQRGPRSGRRPAPPGDPRPEPPHAPRPEPPSGPLRHDGPPPQVGPSPGEEPPHEGPPPRDGLPPRDGPPPRRGPLRGGPAPPTLTIVYTPTAASGAQQQASVQLLLALLAALAMTGLGVRGALDERRRDRLQHALSVQRLLASLGEMSAVLAHEIRNPLGALKGHAQLLVEDLEDAGTDPARAKRLVHESERLEQLVNALLTFVHSGELTLSDTDLVPLINDAVARVPDARVEIVFNENAPRRAVVDGGRFGVALENLIRNAHFAGSGRVVVDVSATSGHLEVSVEDDGPGVSDEIRARIFEPFVTNKTQGTGLGLALSRRIVEAHGGALTLRSPRQLGGAVFAMAFPLRA